MIAGAEDVTLEICLTDPLEELRLSLLLLMYIWAMCAQYNLGTMTAMTVKKKNCQMMITLL
jgi:hypothetical protein